MPPSSARRPSRAPRACPAGVTTLPFDFDIFLRSGSTMKPEIAGVRPRRRAVLELGAQHRREQPGADDVLPLRAQRVREDQVEQLGVALPAARDLRGERRGRPGVHDVELADEAAGLAALGLVVTRAPAPTTGRRAAGRASATIGSSNTGFAVGVERVPDRDRHAEEALARDEPVAGEAADPVLVAHAHEVGVPVDLAAALEQRARAAPRRARRCAMYHWRVETISSGLSPFSKNFTGCVIGFGLADAGRRTRAAARPRPASRENDGLAGELGVGRAAGLGGDGVGRLGEDAAVEADDRAVGQVELAPPDDVGHVAEGADHRDAGALVLLGEVVRERRAPRRRTRASSRWCRTAAGSARRRGARRGPRRPGCSSGRVVSISIVPPSGRWKRHAVVGAGLLAVLELGLGDGGAEGHVPQGGRQRPGRPRRARGCAGTRAAR